MWIRSQNLFTLVKCERLFVRQCESDSFCVIEAGVITLGSYSILDKALKVLDEIQKQIEYPYNSVFQMPQDEDVEV